MISFFVIIKKVIRMKVLSLREPFASLILEEKKRIETRSWKTNYRGELYIHASLGKIKHSDNRIKRLLTYLINKEMKYGLVIAKCKLVDCLYMDEAFLTKIAKNITEADCGHYELGRYAWILEDVIPLDQPIAAKGKLGIWNL